MMQQRFIFVFLFIQINFFMMSMEKELVPCQGYCGEVVYLDQWKIKKSEFLRERQLLQKSVGLFNKPICADLVSEEELKLFSKALDWTADQSLLYEYVRLSFDKRHMLLDVVSKSKLGVIRKSILHAEELGDILTIFYVTGLYMKELIELQKNPLIDAGEKVVDVGNKIIEFIGNEEKNEENLRSYDGYYDDAIAYAKKHGK